MKITEEMVDTISALSRLKLPEEEKVRGGAHEPCVPGEERVPGRRGGALGGPEGSAQKRADTG